MRTGDIVFFGRYKQSTKDRILPLSWRIVDIKDNYALIISNLVLFGKPYNKTLENTSWADCSLRKYLNHNFYYAAFDKEERKSVIYTETGDNKCRDKVFPPSVADVKDYPGFFEKLLLPTGRAFNNGIGKKRINFLPNMKGEEEVAVDVCDTYWLRDSGGSPDRAACISGYTGKPDTDGIPVYPGADKENSIGVRPMMRVDIAALEKNRNKILYYDMYEASPYKLATLLCLANRKVINTADGLAFKVYYHHQYGKVRIFFTNINEHGPECLTETFVYCKDLFRFANVYPVSNPKTVDDLKEIYYSEDKIGDALPSKLVTIFKTTFLFRIYELMNSLI